MIPSSSKLLMMVLIGLHASNRAPTFDTIQAAVAHAEKRMPAVKNVGLVSVRHELEQVIKQTQDLGFIINDDGVYRITEAGKSALEG